MLIVSRAGEVGRSDGAPFLYAPWAEALSPLSVDLLALLPIVGINDAFEAHPHEPSARQGMANAVACMMAADPFIHVPHIARRLRSAGIGAVANFPTVQLMDGETGRALDAGRCGIKREFEFLGEMANSGFSITTFVATHGDIRHAAALRSDRIVVHPGIPMKDWRLRTTAALQAGEIVKAVRSAMPGASLLVYRPAGFGHELDAAIAQADGSLVWSAP